MRPVVKRSSGSVDRLLEAAGRATAKRKEAELTGSDDVLYAALLRRNQAPAPFGLNTYFLGSYASHLPRALGLVLSKKDFSLAKALLAVMRPADKRKSYDENQEGLLEAFPSVFQSDPSLAKEFFEAMSPANRPKVFFAAPRAQAEFVFGLICQLMASQTQAEQLTQKMARYIELALDNPEFLKRVKNSWDLRLEWDALAASRSDLVKYLLVFWDGEKNSLEQALFLPGKEEPTTFAAQFNEICVDLGLAQAEDLVDDSRFLARLSERSAKGRLALKKYMLSVPVAHYPRAILLAGNAGNLALAREIFSSIVRENKIHVFFSSDAKLSAQVFDFFNELRKKREASFPNLTQTHLNKQMANYAKAIGNPKLAQCIENQLGFCHAWSHALAVLTALHQGPWSDAARLCLSVWPGDAASLDQVLFLPGDAKPICLREVFGKMIASLLKDQQVLLGPDVPALPYPATQFAPKKPQHEGEQWQSGEGFRFATQADFCLYQQYSLEEIKRVLSIPQFKALEKSGYVAVGTGIHATYYQVVIKSDGTKSYRVFDSNDGYGRQSFERLSLAAQEILRQQGSTLSLQAVRVLREGEQAEPRAKLEEISRPFDVSETGFLSLLLRTNPSELAIILKVATIPDALWGESCSSICGFSSGAVQVISAPFLFHAMAQHRMDLFNVALKKGAKFSSAISAALALDGPLPTHFMSGLEKALSLLFKKIDVSKQAAVLRDLVKLVHKKSDDSASWGHLKQILVKYVSKNNCSEEAWQRFKPGLAGGKEAIILWYLTSTFYPKSTAQQAGSLFSSKPDDGAMKLGKAILHKKPNAAKEGLKNCALMNFFQGREEEPGNMELLTRLVDVLKPRAMGSKTEGVLAPYVQYLDEMEFFQRMLTAADFCKFLAWLGPVQLGQLSVRPPVQEQQTLSAVR